jgi:hypothetical protein
MTLAWGRYLDWDAALLEAEVSPTAREPGLASQASGLHLALPEEPEALALQTSLASVSWSPQL